LGRSTAAPLALQKLVLVAGPHHHLSVFERVPRACFRTAKGAITVRTLLHHAGHIPAVMVLTEGKRSDLAVARGLHLPVDSIVAMDRGYIDDQFLFRWHEDGVYFVTSQKVNAPVDVTTRFAVARSERPGLSSAAAAGALSGRSDRQTRCVLDECLSLGGHYHRRDLPTALAHRAVL
jgi:hypothetical protein